MYCELIIHRFRVCVCTKYEVTGGFDLFTFVKENTTYSIESEFKPGIHNSQLSHDWIWSSSSKECQVLFFVKLLVASV